MRYRIPTEEEEEKLSIIRLNDCPCCIAKSGERCWDFTPSSQTSNGRQESFQTPWVHPGRADNGN